MRTRNPLTIMAKPPPEVQAQIAALPRNDPSRGVDLLHVSLYDRHHAPPDWFPRDNRRDECSPLLRRHRTTLPKSYFAHPTPKTPFLKKPRLVHPDG